jgi:CRP-like cAMP-binding protein
MGKIALLREAALFATMPDKEIEQISESLIKRTFRKDMVIFHQDNLGSDLFLIESGKVRIFLMSKDGHEITVNIIGAGECFGELSMLDGKPRSAGALAMERTVTYCLKREDFLHLFEANPRIARNVLEIVVQRLRYNTKYAESLAFLDVNGRVALRLLELVDQQGSREDGVLIDLNLTQLDLARWVASSRETVNRVLSNFQNESIINIEGNQIIVLDICKLENIASL